MKKAQLLVSALLLVLLLVACAPKAAPAPAPQTPVQVAAPAPAAAAVPKAPVKAAWETEWEKTLEAARKEGRVSLSTTGGSESRNAVSEGFRAAYGIPVEAVSGKGGQFPPKILAERRAGLYLHDIFLAGASTAMTGLKPAGALDPIPPALILPDLAEPELVKKTWYQGDIYWLDKDRTQLAAGINASYPLAINTNLVKEGDIKSWRDLLNPKWQGKIVVCDPSTGGAATNFMLFVDGRLGWDYLVELVKTKLSVLNDERLMLDWLAHGKVAIVVAPKPDGLPEFVKAGAPVRGLIPAEEGTWISSSSSNLSLFNKPAHPNAAKIFVNWFLSKDGSMVVSKVMGLHMTRLDVPTDYVPPEQLRDPNTKYFNTLTEEGQLKKPALAEKAKPLLAPLMGK